MNTKALKQHIDILKLGYANRVIQPILSNVALNGQLMTADLDTYVIVHESLGDLKTTASLAALEKFVKNTNADTVEFDAEGQGKDELLIAQSGKLKSKFRTLPIDEFPELPDLNEAFRDALVLPGKDLLKAILQVAPSAANYDANNVLGAVSFKFEGATLELAATDGSRMTKVQLPTDYFIKDEQWLIPASKLAAIASKLEKLKPETVRIGRRLNAEEKKGAFSFDWFTLQTDEYTFVLKMIDGRYPLYNQLIPQATSIKRRFSFNSKDLMEALKAIKPFTNDRTSIVKLSFSGGKLTLTATQPDVSDTMMEVAYTSDYQGDHFTAFNINYLMDGIKALDQKTVVLSQHETLHPSVLTDEDLSEAFVYLLMPVQVK